MSQSLVLSGLSAHSWPLFLSVRATKYTAADSHIKFQSIARTYINPAEPNGFYPTRKAYKDQMNHRQRKCEQLVMI